MLYFNFIVLENIKTKQIMKKHTGNKKQNAPYLQHKIYKKLACELE